MRVLSAIAASFGFLYEAFNLGPSLISKVLQSGGTGVWLTGILFLLQAQIIVPKLSQGFVTYCFYCFFIYGPGDRKLANKNNTYPFNRVTVTTKLNLK